MKRGSSRSEPNRSRPVELEHELRRQDFKTLQPEAFGPANLHRRGVGAIILEKAVGTTKGTKDEGLAESGVVIGRVSYSNDEPPRFRPLFSFFSCLSCLLWFNPAAVSRITAN